MPQGLSRLTPGKVILLAAAFVIATGNLSFFRQITEVYPLTDSWGFLLSVSAVLFGAFVVLLSLLSLALPVRIVVTLFLLIAATVGYFQDQFGVIIDVTMLQNALQTDAAETRDLLNGSFFLRVGLLGILPVLLVWKLPLAHSPLMPGIRSKLQLLAGSLLVGVLCLYTYSDVYAGFFRQHKPLRYYTNPTFAIYSAAQLAFGGKAKSVRPPKAVYPGAQLPEADEGVELIIMVVGETARKDRFSLNGYERETNPLLAQKSGLVSYTNMTACGTSTAISVPCMFSVGGMKAFDIDTASEQENLLDVLQKVGVKVLWRDNNSGSKGVADRVLYEDFRSAAVNPVCDTECRDVGMLAGLQEFVDAQDSDILIVLHQMGNHGPAYYKRYPAEFEKFTPACKSEDLGLCSDEEISNAYDNAILYTDYFLSQVIAFLQSNTPRFETAMLYVSDHGESLGERGLYLHGMPRSIAPAEQTEVPVIVWVGDSSDIELASALKLKDRKNSHDAVFNSLLAAFEVDGAALPGSADLFMVRNPQDE